MSVATYTTKAIQCDVKAAPECKAEAGNEHAGMPGQAVDTVRAQAQSAGWRRVRNPLAKGARDACPDCSQVLEEQWA